MSVLRTIIVEIVKLSVGITTAHLLVNKYPDINVFVIVLVAMLAMVVVVTIMGIIYPERSRTDLANRIHRCLLRKEHGPNYCAVCEVGYECAKGELNTSTKEEST